MYFLNTFHTVSNVATFVRCRTNKWVQTQDLREIYLQSLADAQGISLSNSPNLVVSFEESLLAKTIQERGMFEGEGLEIGDRLSEQERFIVEKNIRHGLVLLRSLDERLADMISRVVSDIVCVRIESSGGGTASNLLGIIWLSPDPHWTTIDYAECLLHEFIHQAVFLGDMLYKLYINDDNLGEQGALTISAIRKEKRPIDKSLHSACVSVGVIYYYHLLKDNEKVEKYLLSLRDCVADLTHKKETYLAPYGREVVSLLEKFVKNPDFDWLSEQIGSPKLAAFSDFSVPTSKLATTA